MSLKFPVSEFFEQSGNNAALFNEQLRDLTVTFACSLWSNYPAFITEGTNPVSSFSRGFMNQVCSPIQPPLAPPSLPFFGAQCPTAYFWQPSFRVSRPYASLGLSIGDSLEVQAVTTVIGPIDSTTYGAFNQNQFVTGFTTSGGSDSGNNSFEFSNIPVLWGVDDPNDSEGFGIFISEVLVDSFTRVDGLPDNCGSLPSNYPSNPPSSNDLTADIVIVNLDGVDNVYTIVYNKISNQYNFPMGFKINGVNAILDLSGLTIFGAPEVIQPNSGNDVPVPGSDGGDDGAGGENDETYPGNEYPVIPDLTVPTVVDKLVEYVVCNDGAIESVSDTLKLVTATVPYASLVIDILTNVVTDVCEIGDAEPVVGLPEYYGLKPGARRPAIVYLYKEFLNDVWQKSTYSSTVSNPSSAAIAAISTVNVDDKTMGSFVYSLALTDGSRIKTSGDTEANAATNFNFLLNQVDAPFVPPDVVDCITISEYPKLQVKTVKCRQIEYYPSGKAAGVSPMIRRVIDAP